MQDALKPLGGNHLSHEEKQRIAAHVRRTADPENGQILGVHVDDHLNPDGMVRFTVNYEKYVDGIIHPSRMDPNGMG